MADLSTILKPNNTTLNLYCKNAILNGTNVLNELATLQTEIDNITPNPNIWNNGAGQTTTNQQILFTDNSVNGAITSDKLYFDTDNNLIILDGLPVPTRNEVNYIQEEINTITGQINDLNNSVSGLTRRVDTIETTTATQQTEIDNINNKLNNISTLLNSLTGILIL